MGKYPQSIKAKYEAEIKIITLSDNQPTSQKVCSLPETQTEGKINKVDKGFF